MMQYVPVDGVYVYFRYDANQTVMVVMNTAKVDKIISFNDYLERTKEFTSYTNIITKKKEVIKDFTVGSYKTVVQELNK